MQEESTLDQNTVDLIQAYVSGDHSVAEALLDHCRRNPDVLKALSEQVALNELLHVCVQDDEQLFIEEQIERIKAVQQEDAEQDIAARVHQRLKYHQSDEIKGAIKYNYHRLMSYGAIAAACLMMSLMLINQHRTRSNFGMIQQAVDARWGDVHQDFDGQITSKPMELLQGAAHVRLINGVDLLVEGPARFQIVSPNHVEFTYGSMVAKMPPDARERFKVMTPSSEISEELGLATSWGVNVSEKGASEVHALKGGFSVRAKGGRTFEKLAEKEARRYELARQVAAIESDPQRFLRILPGASQSEPSYLHWSFDDLDEKLRDGAGLFREPIVTQSQGRGELFRQKPGRFPAELKTFDTGGIGPKMIDGVIGKAISLNGEDAWLETSFAGVQGTAPRTVAFWARIPREITRKQSYGMLSWGLSGTPGKAWQISPNPKSEDGIVGAFRIGTTRVFGVGVTDLRDDKWHHLAVVMYGGDQVDMSTHVLLFIDGKLEPMSQKSFAGFDTKTDHPDSRPLMMGQNINGRISHAHGLLFKGDLDEVYIFDAALDQKQIQALMRRGLTDNGV